MGAGFDDIKIRRGLLTGLLILASVFLARFALIQGNWLIGFLIPGILILSLLMARPALLLILVFFVTTAGLKIPDLPESIRVSHILQVVVVGWMLLDGSLQKSRGPLSYKTVPDIWLIVFMVNMLFIMFIRGAGFSIFGSSVYGGAGYVILALAIIFYFSAVRISFLSGHVKILIWAIFSAAIVASIIQILVYFYAGGVLRI